MELSSSHPGHHLCLELVSNTLNHADHVTLKAIMSVSRSSYIYIRRRLKDLDPDVRWKVGGAISAPPVSLNLNLTKIHFLHDSDPLSVFMRVPRATITDIVWDIMSEFGFGAMGAEMRSFSSQLISLKRMTLRVVGSFRRPIADELAVDLFKSFVPLDKFPGLEVLTILHVNPLSCFILLIGPSLRELTVTFSTMLLGASIESSFLMFSTWLRRLHGLRRLTLSSEVCVDITVYIPPEMKLMYLKVTNICVRVPRGMKIHEIIFSGAGKCIF
jgi:hypothetical protein